MVSGLFDQAAAEKGYSRGFPVPQFTHADHAERVYFTAVSAEANAMKV
jgi:hypothetical protein